MPLSENITLTGLLSDTLFRNWVKSGDFRLPGNEWSDWRIQNPEHEEILGQAINILLASHIDENIPESDVDDIIAGTWARIGNQEKVITPLFRWWWVAASATLLVSCLFLLKNKTRHRTASQLETIADSRVPQDNEKMNTSKKPMLIILSDSSSVLLTPGSTLKFPSLFKADSREVELTGEAFFEISKNPSRPFFVHTQTITTRVLGTSFKVRAFAGEPDVNITVKTGKVSVYQTKPGDQAVPNDAVVLLPDQNLLYHKVQHSMIQSVTSASPSDLRLTTASFEFTDSPVTAILDSIASAYGLKMDYDEANLSKCILTTSLTDSPLQGKLKIICRALGKGAHYKISENKIEISAPGCD